MNGKNNDLFKFRQSAVLKKKSRKKNKNKKQNKREK